MTLRYLFQSPLGEVVKETVVGSGNSSDIVFQSPLGEVVKETIQDISVVLEHLESFNPLSGKW